MPSLFIAGDWGTTQLRLFLCDGDTVLETRVGRGIRTSTCSPAEEFTRLAQEWVDTRGVSRVILCGMVGSRNGWIEVPYLPCPAAPTDVARALHRLAHRSLEIDIVPGLVCTAASGAPDVMRGEETQLIGALRLHPELANGRHLFALPGTHSKWVAIGDGRIEQFQTALTGELFALLTSHSTLLAANTDDQVGTDEEAFAQALADRGPLLQRLFQVRSRQLIERMNATQARGLLSGLLIGAEIDGALDASTVATVTLIGEPALTARYARALATRNIEAVAVDGNACVLAGLQVLRAKEVR